MNNNICPLRCVGNYLYDVYCCVRNSCCPRYAVRELVEELSYKLELLEARIAILYECDYTDEFDQRILNLEHEVYGCEVCHCECCQCGDDCQCGDNCECCKCGEEDGCKCGDKVEEEKEEEEN